MPQMGSDKELQRVVEVQNKMGEASLPVIGLFRFWKKNAF